MAVRLDRWLCAARFFKTRGDAANAIQLGRVLVNRSRSKPSKQISVGEEVSVTKGPYNWTVDVCALAEKRLPASQAQALYREHPESILRRETTAAAMKEDRARQQSGVPQRRPTKKERRDLQKLRGKDPS